MGLVFDRAVLYLVYLLCGQLHILKSVPNSSLSSSVLGKCVHSVSGRKSAVKPPATDSVPMITRGSTWL